MKYAKDTQVSVEKSKIEIEQTVTRYGASQFMSGWKENSAMIGFKMKERNIRFILPLPLRSEKRFTKDKYGHSRPESKAIELWEQEQRQRWRALALAVKAKLEVVESGISTFEDEFMAHIILPSGQTVAEWMGPQIRTAYETGLMPPMLPYMPEERKELTQ